MKSSATTFPTAGCTVHCSLCVTEMGMIYLFLHEFGREVKSEGSLAGLWLKYDTYGKKFLNPNVEQMEHLLSPAHLLQRITISS